MSGPYDELVLGFDPDLPEDDPSLYRRDKAWHAILAARDPEERRRGFARVVTILCRQAAHSGDKSGAPSVAEVWITPEGPLLVAWETKSRHDPVHGLPIAPGPPDRLPPVPVLIYRHWLGEPDGRALGVYCRIHGRIPISRTKLIDLVQKRGNPLAGEGPAKAWVTDVTQVLDVEPDRL